MVAFGFKQQRSTKAVGLLFNFFWRYFRLSTPTPRPRFPAGTVGYPLLSGAQGETIGYKSLPKTQHHQGIPLENSRTHHQLLAR